MTSFGYIIVDSCIISLNLDYILQLKQFYNKATKVSCRKKCYYFWWSTWLLYVSEYSPTHDEVMAPGSLSHYRPFVLRTLQWRHNGHHSVSNHQPHDCLLNRLFRRRSTKTSKLCVTGLCVGNSPGTGEFPTQMASNAENVSIWWRHHDSPTACRRFLLIKGQ